MIFGIHQLFFGNIIVLNKASLVTDIYIVVRTKNYLQELLVYVP